MGVDWWLGLGCLKLNDQGATDAPAEPPELSHYLIKLTTRSPWERKQLVNVMAARGKHLGGEVQRLALPTPRSGNATPLAVRASQSVLVNRSERPRWNPRPAQHSILNYDTSVSHNDRV